ncbi:MAG: sulfite exporter TauE/SafE family protein, partial [Proteobacteria bacterium]|nr:sulfite exporter TauE/SafE family protein [Pseudomonadota bacterium]
IPKYLNQLGLVNMKTGDIDLMTKISFGIMCFALVVGAAIILGSMWKARSPRFAVEESYGKV